MAKFNPLEQHSIDYFKQNMISLESVELSAAPKERKSGLAGFFNKVWRRLSRWDLQPSSIQNRMIEVAQSVLASRYEPEGQKLTKLSNLYANIINFETAVAQKHNRSPLSYLLFWAYMPRPPKQTMDRIAGFILEKVDDTLKDSQGGLKLIYGADESLNRIKELKSLVQAVETLDLVKPIDSQRIQSLKTKCVEITCREISHLNRLAKGVKESIDDNKWPNHIAFDFKVLDNTISGNFLDRILQELPEGSKKNAAEQDIKNIKEAIDKSKSKIQADQKALEDAENELIRIMNTSSLDDLPKMINRGISLDRFRRWSSRTYLPCSAKDRLSSWISYFEHGVCYLSNAEDALKRINVHENHILNLPPKDFTYDPSHVPRSPYTVGLRTIEKELESIRNEITRLDTRLGFPKITSGLREKQRILSGHLEEARQVAQLLQTADRLSTSFHDERWVVDNMKRTFPGKFDERLPFDRQYQTLIVEPIQKYLKKLADEGKGLSEYAREAADMLAHFIAVKDAYPKLRSKIQELQQELQKDLKQTKIDQAEFKAAITGIRNKFEDYLKDPNLQILNKHQFYMSFEQENMQKEVREFQELLGLFAEFDEACSMVQDLTREILAEEKRNDPISIYQGVHWSSLEEWERKLFSRFFHLKASKLANSLFDCDALEQQINAKHMEIKAIDITRQIWRNYFSPFYVTTQGERRFSPGEIIKGRTLLNDGKRLLKEIPAGNSVSGLLSRSLQSLEGLVAKNSSGLPSLAEMVKECKDLALDHICHQVKTSWLKESDLKKPSELDISVWDALISSREADAFVRSKLHDLKALVEKMPYYMQCWNGVSARPGVEKSYEVPEKNSTADKQMDLLREISKEGKLDDDVKRVVDMLVKMYESRFHPRVTCPISHELIETPACIRTKEGFYHYFEAQQILQWLQRSNLHPVTKEPVNAGNVFFPVVAQKLVADYRNWCRDKGISLEEEVEG